MSSRESLIMALYETIKHPPKEKEPTRFNKSTGSLHSRYVMDKLDKKTQVKK